MSGGFPGCHTLGTNGVEGERRGRVLRPDARLSLRTRDRDAAVYKRTKARKSVKRKAAAASIRRTGRSTVSFQSRDCFDMYTYRLLAGLIHVFGRTANMVSCLSSFPNYHLPSSACCLLLFLDNCIHIVYRQFFPRYLFHPFLTRCLLPSSPSPKMNFSHRPSLPAPMTRIV